MVCQRCILVVDQIIKNKNIVVKSIHLGVIEFEDKLTDDISIELKNELEKVGFEWLNDKEQMLITKVKTLLIELLQDMPFTIDVPLSVYLSKELDIDYQQLSQLFSQIESTTIEAYFIALKIEKVKELLIYNEMNLKEITYQLNYSSVAHLSTQFKKVAGMTPTDFKNITQNFNDRKQLDQL